MVKQKKNEITMMQKHCANVESMLKDITNKYRNIIPEIIYHNVRRTPGNKQQKNVLEHYYLVTEDIVILITMLLIYAMKY